MRGQRWMRLMAIMAHPDDAEIWAGGTIFKHTQRGDVVLIVYRVATQESVRGGEAKQGAALLGAQVSFVGRPDGQVRETPETCERVSALLRGFAPDALITHWIDDFHADHAATAATVQPSWGSHCASGPVTHIFRRGHAGPLCRTCMWMSPLRGRGSSQRSGRTQVNGPSTGWAWWSGNVACMATATSLPGRNRSLSMLRGSSG
ncbi:MAG: PIG-L family deacetylase [Nitrospinae bacterium]|nr:PIG-L family deacetylase [Nitrospinota bacterium]